MIVRLGSAGLAFRCIIAAAALGALQASARTIDTAAALSGPGSLDGVWVAGGSRKFVDGKPPLTREAQALLDNHKKLVKSGKASGHSPEACVPPGMPDLMDPKLATAIQFIETPEQHQVSVLSESYRTFRIIRLDAQHPADPDPSFQGNSIGHWEGDVLVVDTIGLQASTDVFGLGIPHSEDMHLVERIRRLDRATLEDRMTIEDPTVFSRPFAVRITLKSAPGKLLQERIVRSDRHPLRGFLGLALLVGLAMGAGVSAGMAQPPSANAGAGKAPAGPGSLSGVWFNSDFVPAKMFDPEGQVVLTDQGKRPPLQPWAAALLGKRIEAAKRGQTFATTLSQCLPTGMPAMMYYPANPMQILESKGQVTILLEQLTLFRVIRLDAAHLPHPKPSFFGDSVGHWEGDTLVVDTTGLNTRTTLDEPGTPHSEALHIVERFRRIAPNMIEVAMRMEDPKTFTGPWTLVTHLKREPPDRQLEEWYCENQRNPVGANGLTTSIPATDAASIGGR